MAFPGAAGGLGAPSWSGAMGEDAGEVDRALAALWRVLGDVIAAGESGGLIAIGGIIVSAGYLLVH